MPFKKREDYNRYKRDYYKTQCEKDKELRQQFNTSLDLLEDFVKARMSEGLSREQAEEQFYSSTTPPEVGTATDTPTASELIERSKRLIEMKIARDNARKSDSTPQKKVSWQDELDRKRRERELAHKAIDVLASVEKTVKHSDIKEAQKLLEIAQLIEDVKKSSPEEWAKIQNRPGRKDEYAKGTAMGSTVGNLYGLSPDEYGKSPEEIRKMREKKKVKKE